VKAEAKEEVVVPEVEAPVSELPQQQQQDSAEPEEEEMPARLSRTPSMMERISSFLQGKGWEPQLEGSVEGGGEAESEKVGVQDAILTTIDSDSETEDGVLVSKNEASLSLKLDVLSPVAPHSNARVKIEFFDQVKAEAKEEVVVPEVEAPVSELPQQQQQDSAEPEEEEMPARLSRTPSMMERISSFLQGKGWEPQLEGSVEGGGEAESEKVGVQDAILTTIDSDSETEDGVLVSKNEVSTKVRVNVSFPTWPEKGSPARVNIDFTDPAAPVYEQSPFAPPAAASTSNALLPGLLKKCVSG